MRDTIARQSDVDQSSLRYEVEPGEADYREGTITFSLKGGKSLDLDKLHESIQATRLSGKTRSAVNYLLITAQGKVVVGEGDMLLQVTGTKQQFGLGDDPNAKPKDGATPFQRLREALAGGAKVAKVTGRVQGWSGPWPVVLRALAVERVRPDESRARQLPLLIVTDFQIAKQ